MENLTISFKRCGCLRIERINVEIKCSFIISYLCGKGFKNCYNNCRPLYDAESDLDIKDGLIALMKNI